MSGLERDTGLAAIRRASPPANLKTVDGAAMNGRIHRNVPSLANVSTSIDALTIDSQ